MAKVNQEAVTSAITYSRNKQARATEAWKGIEWEPTQEQEDANAELNSIKSTLESLTPQSSNTQYEQVLDSINSLQGDNGLSNKGEAYLKVALDTYEDKVQLRDERGALLTDLETLYSEIDTQMSADKFGEFDSDTVNSLEKELTNMVTTNASFLNQNVDMPQYYSKLKDIDEWLVAGNLLKSKDELPLELIGINEILDMKNVETDAIEGQEFMNAPFAQGQSPFKFNAYDLDGNQGVGREILLGGASPDKYRAKGATNFRERGDWWEGNLPEDELFNSWIKEWSTTAPGQKYISENDLKMNLIGTDAPLKEFSSQPKAWTGLMFAYTTHLNDEFVKNNYSHSKDNRYGMAFSDIDMEGIGASYNSFVNTVGSTFGLDNISGFEDFFKEETIGFQTSASSTDGLKVVHDNLLHQAFDSYALGQGASAGKYISGANQSLLSAYNIDQQLQSAQAKETQLSNWNDFEVALSNIDSIQLKAVNDYMSSDDINFRRSVIESPNTKDSTRDLILNIERHSAGMPIYPSGKNPLLELNTLSVDFEKEFGNENNQKFQQLFNSLDDKYHQPSTDGTSGIHPEILAGLPFSDVYTSTDKLFINGELQTGYQQTQMNAMSENLKATFKQMDGIFTPVPNSFETVLKNLYGSGDFSSSFDAFIADPDAVSKVGDTWVLSKPLREWILSNAGNNVQANNTIEMIEDYLMAYDMLDNLSASSLIIQGSKPVGFYDGAGEVDNFKTQLLK